jgi:hypothetical protein
MNIIYIYHSIRGKQIIHINNSLLQTNQEIITIASFIERGFVLTFRKSTQDPVWHINLKSLVTQVCAGHS